MSLLGNKHVGNSDLRTDKLICRGEVRNNIHFSLNTLTKWDQKYSLHHCSRWWIIC